MADPREIARGLVYVLRVNFRIRTCAYEMRMFVITCSFLQILDHAIMHYNARQNRIICLIGIVWRTGIASMHDWHFACWQAVAFIRIGDAPLTVPARTPPVAGALRGQAGGMAAGVRARRFGRAWRARERPVRAAALQAPDHREARPPPRTAASTLRRTSSGSLPKTMIMGSLPTSPVW